MKNIELDSNKWGVRDIYDQGKLAGIPPQAMRLLGLHATDHSTMASEPQKFMVS